LLRNIHSKPGARKTVGSGGTRSFQPLLTAPDSAHTRPVAARDKLVDVPVSCAYLHETS
jgi:hypothetical protein